jgi:hypothetical protein
MVQACSPACFAGDPFLKRAPKNSTARRGEITYYCNLPVAVIYRSRGGGGGGRGEGARGRLYGVPASPVPSSCRLPPSSPAINRIARRSFASRVFRAGKKPGIPAYICHISRALWPSPRYYFLARFNRKLTRSSDPSGAISLRSHVIPSFVSRAEVPQEKVRTARDRRERFAHLQREIMSDPCVYFTSRGGRGGRCESARVPSLNLPYARRCFAKVLRNNSGKCMHIPARVTPMRALARNGTVSGRRSRIPVPRKLKPAALKSASQD